MHRVELFLVAGEVHRQLKPAPSPAPGWLAIPERRLYTGICVIGAIGSGKTQAVILPAMRQLFAYRANDPGRRLSGVVLEVKGDLCRQVRAILHECGRTDDYVEVSGDVRYNPLNNDADAYAQAFNIASVITAIWVKGKEPFWQQSYTDLVRYVIMLHRVRDNYVTLLDIFRTVISSGSLEEMLIETGRHFTSASFVGVGKTTLLNVLSDAIPEADRILTIEDTVELYIRKPQIVSAEAQTDTHRNQIGFDELLRAVLRHRPDRIIVGEVRGAEARTLLDAMNTGHRRTLATIHASSCTQAISRLAALANRVPGSPGVEASEREVRGSLDTVVFISRAGSRRHVREILSLVQSNASSA